MAMLYRLSRALLAVGRSVLQGRYGAQGMRADESSTARTITDQRPRVIRRPPSPRPCAESTRAPRRNYPPLKTNSTQDLLIRLQHGCVGMVPSRDDASGYCFTRQSNKDPGQTSRSSYREASKLMDKPGCRPPGGRKKRPRRSISPLEVGTRDLLQSDDEGH